MLKSFCECADNNWFMDIRRYIRKAAGSDERGFTLPEVMMVIVVMGILAAIAIPSWASITEGGRADSAANQFASDLRLAHSRATNQLTDWRVIYDVGESDYQLLKLSEPCSEGGTCTPVAEQVINRTLPEGTSFVCSSNSVDPLTTRFSVFDLSLTALPAPVNDPGENYTIEFNSDGGSYVESGPSAGLRVGSDVSNAWKITVQSATSRVKVKNKTETC